MPIVADGGAILLTNRVQMLEKYLEQGLFVLLGAFFLWCRYKYAQLRTQAKRINNVQ